MNFSVLSLILLCHAWDTEILSLVSYIDAQCHKLYFILNCYLSIIGMLDFY